MRRNRLGECLMKYYNLAVRTECYEVISEATALFSSWSLFFHVVPIPTMAVVWEKEVEEPPYFMIYEPPKTNTTTPSKHSFNGPIFVCSYSDCSRKFTRKTTLENHILGPSHLNEKPYK